MRIGAFELDEPVPELNEPYAFVILKPWIDVNNVGTLVLNELESTIRGRGNGEACQAWSVLRFYRYRPTLYLEQGVRRMSIPNVTVRWAKREGGNDLLFLHLLEPHALSEVFVDSVLKLLKHFNAKKYILLGSMYDWVPHTRPLILIGGATGREAVQDLKKSGALQSSYQGPTSIVTSILQEAPEIGIETIWLIVALPQYVVVEEDYLGKVRLMEVLNLLYDIPVDNKDFERALEQRTSISQRMEGTPELKNLLPQLESAYELRTESKEVEGVPKLSSEMEELLWKIMGKDPEKPETKH